MVTPAVRRELVAGLSIGDANAHQAEGPLEVRLLDEVVVRRIEGPAERQHQDELPEREHYLRHANAIGEILRYVAEYRGHGVAVVTFGSATLSGRLLSRHQLAGIGGATRGLARRGQDFFTDTEQPKELWVRPLSRQAFPQLRAPVFAADLRAGGRLPPPPPVPVPTAQLGSLAACLRRQVRDPRDPQGLRHSLGSVITTATLAIAAGCQGPHAIAAFAASLNHGQHRRLGCRRRPGAGRQYDVPCERTFARLLAAIAAGQLTRAFTAWMATLDPVPVPVHARRRQSGAQC